MEERMMIYLCLARMSEDGAELRYVKEALRDPSSLRSVNCYYYRSYSVIKDIQMILCTVLGKKMHYAGEMI